MGNFDLSQRTLTVDSPETVSQWRSVLRLSTGDKVILTDGTGMEAEATIESLDKKSAVLSLSDRREVSREPKRRVTLYAALLRRENFELIVQKATELGAYKLVPIVTTRTVKTGHNAARLQKILTEACEQSGRTHKPLLSEPIAFEQALAGCAPNETFLFHVSEAARTTDFASEAINLFIGPEGGFTEEEVALAQSSGVHVRSLGRLTLRAETAAIAATFAACML